MAHALLFWEYLGFFRHLFFIKTVSPEKVATSEAIKVL